MLPYQPYHLHLHLHLHLLPIGLLVLSLASKATWAFNCSIPPIYVDIHLRAVHGMAAFQYGSFIGAGTPAMNQSLWVSLRANETTFTSAEFCETSNLTNCDERGAFFEPDLSTR
jgi:hypothetical protein